METQPLKESIDRLYAAFADLQKPRKIEGCLHCLDEKEIGVMLRSPLRELAPEELTSYAASAFLTVGDVPDYLYFLPRILEISAMDDSWWPDPEVTGRCIKTANPANWPVHQVAALLNFNGAVIQSAITSGEYDKLDPWMCAIARMGLDVARQLEQISKCPAAVLAYFDANVRCLREHRLCNQGQRQLTPVRLKDFQHKLRIPAARAALHDETSLAGVLLEQRKCEPIQPGKVFARIDVSNT